MVSVVGELFAVLGFLGVLSLLIEAAGVVGAVLILLAFAGLLVALLALAGAFQRHLDLGLAILLAVWVPLPWLTSRLDRLPPTREMRARADTDPVRALHERLYRLWPWPVIASVAISFIMLSYSGRLLDSDMDDRHPTAAGVMVAGIFVACVLLPVLTVRAAGRVLAKAEGRRHEEDKREVQKEAERQRQEEANRHVQPVEY